MRFAQIALLLIPRGFAALLLLTIVLEGESRADWPEGTITIIVPFPRDGATDMLGAAGGRTFEKTWTESHC